MSTEVPVRNIFGADRIESFFIPNLLPINPAHAESPFLGWQSSKFNKHVLAQFEVAQQEQDPWEKAAIERGIGEQVRTYWGNILKTHARQVRGGAKEPAIKVNWKINAHVYAPDDIWELMPLHIGGRHRITAERESEYEEDVLIVDNPDARDHRFHLLSRSYSFPDKNVVTETEISMMFLTADATYPYEARTRDLSIARAQYSPLSAAPDFWEKVAAGI